MLSEKELEELEAREELHQISVQNQIIITLISDYFMNQGTATRLVRDIADGMFHDNQLSIEY